MAFYVSPMAFRGQQKGQQKAMKGRPAARPMEGPPPVAATFSASNEVELLLFAI